MPTGTNPNPKITISGFDIEWNLEQGLNLWAGIPTLSMWISTSVAGLMQGFAAMVGVERFNLCLQIGGQQSVDGDWAIISSKPTFEEGFALLADIAWPAGHGRWQILSLDRAQREARYRISNGWESIYQKKLGVDWGSAMVAGKLAGITGRLFGVPCWAEQTRFSTRGEEHDEFVVRPTDVSFDDRLAELLEQGRATSSDLSVALGRLKDEIEERERTELELREKLELIQEQEAALRTLSAPIIQVWEGILAVPVMGGLNHERASALMERLLKRIVGSRTEHVILDLTAVESVDTSTADHLVRIVRAVELLGAQVVVTGIGPSVAQTLAALGVSLGDIKTLRDMQEGLRACMAAPTARPRRARDA